MTITTLFSPITVGKINLSHRIVLCPLTRLRANKDAVPNDLMKEYYSQRATEGGLLITEATFISRHAGTSPGAPGIYTQNQINGWKKITDGVHSKGGSIFLQLWHLGRVAIAADNEGQQPISASEITINGNSDNGRPHEKPRIVTVPEMKEILQQYRQAALNAMEAGFDGVEIHSANGYLLDQFINSSSNMRTDAYGGSIKNRCRFSLEVIDTIVDAIGANRTAIRFSPWSGYKDVEDETPYETWGYLVQSIQNNHPDLGYIHFIEPRLDKNMDGHKETENTLDPFRKIWKGPFISAGSYTHDVNLASETVKRTGNLIGFGRLFIANPDLVERIRHNLPFNKYNRATFYVGKEVGYTDYPFYESK
ncbi:FMN-linked oxidoreductase [Backusella circina FSU 941]|nr:FMN-linked oxidoreductase [Backusella circina FSU 941]